ncbi:MAG: AraC family transcriptional regulator [Burkholderiales bacterium]|nr:AraC family transcriptional regulator [Burkholderiales bacterium]
MSDRLSALLQRFELSARVFHSGALCGAAAFDAEHGVGHLHLLRHGRLGVTDAQGRRSVLDEPSVLFFPRPAAHRLDADPKQGAELVCAAVEFGVGDENPLLRALPVRLLVPLARLPGLELTQQLLFGEAFGQRCGHDAVANRLTEVLMIQVLRYAIEQRLVDGGLMAGLADPRLHKALSAVHAEPARAWTLQSMAAEAGMSRARFAAHFAQLVGVPPGEYLIGWRLGLARAMLRRGLPVKHVAVEVGYANASALGRVFSQRLGQSPSAWQQRRGTLQA